MSFVGLCVVAVVCVVVGAAVAVGLVSWSCEIVFGIVLWWELLVNTGFRIVVMLLV